MSPEYDSWSVAKKAIGSQIDAYFDAGGNGVPREKLGEGGFLVLVNTEGVVQKLVLEGEATVTSGVIADARKQKSPWHHVLPLKGSSKQRAHYYELGASATASPDDAIREGGKKKIHQRRNFQTYRIK